MVGGPVMVSGFGLIWYNRVGFVYLGLFWESVVFRKKGVFLGKRGR